MPFGITDAPGTFQRAIYSIGSLVRLKFSVVSLEDIIVFSKTIDEHITQLKAGINLLKEGVLRWIYANDSSADPLFSNWVT